MGKHGRRGADSDSDSGREREQRQSAKKVAKVAKLLGYSNDINPFGDANLLTPFVWGKKKDEEEKDKKKKDKKDKDKKRGRDDREETDNRMELLGEIEKVRKRRQDRENELAEMERLRDEEQRLREMAAFGDWQRKEEEFHLEQAKERSRLRLMEDRQRPMDEIAANLILVEIATAVLTAQRSRLPVDAKLVDFLHLDAHLLAPGDLISRISSMKETTELLEDISAYEQLDQQKGRQHQHLWDALRTIAVAQKKTLQDPDRLRSALHDSIVEDVKELLRGKSVEQLDGLERDIKSHLVPGQAVDVEYWELLLDEVILQRAKATAQQWHKAVLAQWSALLPDLRDADILSTESRHKKTEAASQSKAQRPVTVDDLAIAKYLREVDVDLDDEDGDEVPMHASEEVPVPVDPAASWALSDKYKPRKPRYFNRVKTGWERSKYNLTHYDSDNPPPKVIQGYKFTVFYPDLLDKTKTPRFVLEPCADSPNNEFVIIRFTAGPPYEDVAFKIVNKEWDKHRHSGFVCVFDRGIMQLHFNFKRVFYRR